MKKPVYKIQIAEPCQEDWNAMQPDAKGRFCGSCCKSVVDFSNMSDTQIQDYLLHYKDQKVCGHFKSTQVNRPLNIRVDLKNLPDNMSVTKRFMVALFFVFGSFLFSCKDVNGQVAGEISIEPEEEIVFVKGKVKLPATRTAEPTEIRDSLISIQDEELLIKGDVKINEVNPPLGKPEVIDEGKNISMRSCDPAGFPPDTIPSILPDPMSYAILGGITFQEVIADTTAPGFQEKELTSIPQSGIAESPGLAVFPNPSSGEFNIRYDLRSRSSVKLTIFDLRGSLVKSVVNLNEQYEGSYTIPVDLKGLPEGVYLVNLVHNGRQHTERLILENK